MADIEGKKVDPDSRNIENTATASRISSPDFEQEILACAPRLRGRALTAMLVFVAGTGFTLFGYARLQSWY